MSTIEASSSSSGAHFVLIHGASHGAWCWYKLRCLLEGVGNRVTCLDLGGSGIHPSHADSLLTFDDYNQPLLHFMSTLPPNHKVILVGHSAGGTNVVQILHKFPQNVQAAVFVVAAMYPSGKQAKGSAKELKMGDIWSYGYGLGVEEGPTSVLVKPEYVNQLYYNMSPIEDVTLAKMLLRPCPIRALMDAEFGEEWEGGGESVKRVYIKTMNDQMVNREREDEMLKKWAPHQIYEIQSDHSPFFSNPSSLSAILSKVATEFP